MEQSKKSANASLESIRPTAFLLGIALALALLFVALQLNTGSSDEALQAELDNDIEDAMEMSPAEDRSDMISASVPATPSPAVTEKIKAVDTQKEAPERLSPNTDKALVGDGTAIAGNAHVDDAAAEQPISQQTENDDVKDLRIVEQIPVFPGGPSQLTKWLTLNLRYPPEAQRRKLQGKVVVTFIINRDGSISQPKIEQSVDPLLDREVLRVVRLMPKWTPGIENGKPCRTLFAIPVVFQL